MRLLGILRGIGSLSALLAIAACAPIALKPPEAPLDFGFTGGAGRQVRIVTPFTDFRPRGACAERDDPEHMAGKGKPKSTAPLKGPEADLRCSDVPAAWFAEGLATALTGAGFRVLAPNEPGTGDVIRIEGSLQRLSVEEVTQYAIFEGDVSIALTVTSPSGLVARRSFYTKAARPSWTRYGALQRVLDESAERSMREMTAALLSLANRYPSLGM